MNDPPLIHPRYLTDQWLGLSSIASTTDPRGTAASKLQPVLVPKDRLVKTFIPPCIYNG